MKSSVVSVSFSLTIHSPTIVGEGAYSSVYNVRRHQDGKTYALKKVKMGKLSDKERENALNEVRILASVKHKNICAYHEAFIDETSQSLW